MAIVRLSALLYSALVFITFQFILFAFGYTNDRKSNRIKHLFRIQLKSAKKRFEKFPVPGTSAPDWHRGFSFPSLICYVNQLNLYIFGADRSKTIMPII